MTHDVDMAHVVSEVGGGIAYDEQIEPDQGAHIVADVDGFRQALEEITAGEIIYIEDDAALDLTGEAQLSVGVDDVTIASGRGREGSNGALLKTTEYPQWLFRFRAEGIRVTGLRLQGPRTNYFDPRDEEPDPEEFYATGIHFLGDDWEVDNCELSGWTHAAIASGANSYVVSGHAHHNHIHHCQMETLGYGAELYNGHSLWEFNHFDATRHAIAGFGHETNSYEARCNLIGPETVSHAFDMHGLRESADHDGDLAGKRIDIHHNTIQFTTDTLGRDQEAVAIRGVPVEESRIDRNWFAHPDEPQGAGGQGDAVRQETVEEWTNVTVGPDNHYGTVSAPNEGGIGCPRAEGLTQDEVDQLVDDQIQTVGDRLTDELRRFIRD